MSSTSQAFIKAYQREGTAVATPPRTVPKQAAPATWTTSIVVDPGAEDFAPVGEPFVPSPAPPIKRQHVLHPAHAPIVAAVPPIAVPPVTQAAKAKRPLSEILREQATERAEPTTVVSRFRWPAVTNRLLTQHAELYSRTLEAISQFSTADSKVIGLAGTQRSVGCTTTTLCLARQAAGLGRRVAIVEGQLLDSSLASELGIKIERGLVQTLRAGADVEQFLTYSHEERIGLLAWEEQPPISITPQERFHLSLASSFLRFHYDLVLVDLGAISRASKLSQQMLAALHIDATLLVTPAPAQEWQIADTQRMIAEQGRAVLGVVETEI